MNNQIVSLLITLTICLTVHAAPATQPVTDDAKINSLIQQLGDDNYHTRQAVTEELTKIGKPALPALREAAKSNNPEVSSRAYSIVRSLEDKPKTKTPEEPIMPPGIVLQGGAAHMQVTVVHRIGPGSTDIETNTNGRKVHVVENAEGIKVSITEKDANGEDQTREFTAKNAAELKKEHPDAYADYEQAKGPMEIGNLGNIANVIVGGQGQIQIPAEVQKNLQEELTVITAGEAEVMEQATEFGTVVAPAGEDIKAQLGEGVIVRKVDPDSRAEKIGLQPSDLVQKVNGKAVTSTDDFTTAIGDEGKLKIDVLRQSKPLQLQEK